MERKKRVRKHYTVDDILDEVDSTRLSKQEEEANQMGKGFYEHIPPDTGVGGWFPPRSWGSLGEYTTSALHMKDYSPLRKW